MVRLTYREAAGELRVAHSDHRARTPQEAIRRAANALRSKNPRVRIHGTSPRRTRTTPGRDAERPMASFPDHLNHCFVIHC